MKTDLATDERKKKICAADQLARQEVKQPLIYQASDYKIKQEITTNIPNAMSNNKNFFRFS